MLFRVLVALLVFAAVPVAAQSVPFRLRPVAEGLDQPVFATAPAGDPRLFVVEQSGRIRVIANGAASETPFLDVSDRISFGGERGLLGLAFHPDYASNGRFFVYYTASDGAITIAEHRVTDDPAIADADPIETLVSIPHPRGNHNGGWLAFGPDGLLYAATGDGGGGGDPDRNGQNPETLLGKLLRFDVDAGGDPEVFAIGLRNPWRNAFDGALLYIADVGQNEWEEINVIAAGEPGANLGWSVMEGQACYRPSDGCDQSGKVLPIHVYDHTEGCSITGGYVYRGSAIPAIEGRYFFADYCAGYLQSLVHADGAATEVTSYEGSLGPIGPVTSFGLDASGELYVMTQDGRLMQFVPAE
ncbi:MAG TPA: PQQ-dependent sugar dehydrogenase [Alphaproteobacteria bacterium]|nr:PQQ-dependent sugar dehydrogenase [Alphaproteobacteria bacterium]